MNNFILMAAKEVQNILNSKKYFYKITSCTTNRLLFADEATDAVLQKYSSFLSSFDFKLDEIHQKNLNLISNLVDYGPYFKPRLRCQFTERTEIACLLRTCGNMELNRILMVLAGLCQEMNDLAIIGLDKFIYPLVLYGEESRLKAAPKPSLSNESSGSELVMVSKLLPVLFDLLCFLRRCHEVVRNLTLQMQELFTKDGKKLSHKACIEVEAVRFDALFQHFGLLIITLINIEEVIANQSLLRRDFINYKRTFEIVLSKSSDFDVHGSENSKMRLLHEIHCHIEKEIIDNKIYRQLIDTVQNSSSVASSGITTICDHLAVYIKNSLQFFESGNNLLKDDKKWLSINAFLVFYLRLCKNDDRKIVKMISESYKKVNITFIHLNGNCTICLDKFLQKHIPKSKLDKKAIEYLTISRENSIKTSLPDKVMLLNTKLNVWMLQFDDVIREDESLGEFIDLLQKQFSIMTEGLSIANQSSSLAKNYIHQHLISSKAMTKSDLVAVCKLVTILKSIELAYSCRKGEILLILSKLTQYYSYHILDALNVTKIRLIAEVKKYSEKKLDVLSAIILASNCIHGPIMITERQILASLCFSISNQSMTENELNKVNSGFKKIKNLSMIFRRLEDWTKCDFLFFNRSLLGIYFNYCAKKIETIFELRYFFQAITEFVPLLRNAYSYNENLQHSLIKSIKEEILNLFKKEFIDKLCSDFETKLRLQVHSDLQLDDQNPLRQNVQSFASLSLVEPLHLFDEFVSVKESVEQYLNQLAYNMSTIALHDWKTYESMLNLARHVYGLQFTISQLPTQTVEQGLDVLETTRNIETFVSEYNYNLCNQMFVEKTSENKHLNVLLIKHIANSIKTHGFGIINTAVNFTYQFLKSKLYTFSQYLYEDPIKSRLIKDVKNLRETKDGKFAYERADYLVKGVRKLGLTSDGLSYLDQLRLVITEIGNALGFVRMLRSGALHCSSNVIAFVPDMEELGKISFKDLVIKEGFNGECLKSSENLDNILNLLNRNFTEATNYLNLLVQVFQSTLKDGNNYHLKNFYIIVPALTINYVENCIVKKEKITRKNILDATFTDDGFPMGVAYILRLLDQHNEFDSLQWFACIKETINKERETAKTANINQGPDKNAETVILTERRLGFRQKEFNLLNYSLTSCRILFKATNENND